MAVTLRRPATHASLPPGLTWDQPRVHAAGTRLLTQQPAQGGSPSATPPSAGIRFGTWVSPGPTHRHRQRQRPPGRPEGQPHPQRAHTERLKSATWRFTAEVPRLWSQEQRWPNSDNWGWRLRPGANIGTRAGTSGPGEDPQQVVRRCDQVGDQSVARQPGQAIPRRPIISLRSSESTSFMLGALRVLHVDTSQAPAEAAAIVGKALSWPISYGPAEQQAPSRQHGEPDASVELAAPLNQGVSAHSSWPRTHRLASRRAIVQRSPRPVHGASASDSVESAWGAVPALLLVRFPRPLAEPGVRVSPHRALHGFCRGVVQAAWTQGLGIWLPR